MTKVLMDGNRAAAYLAYAFTEVAAVYPITPSSPMAEAVDEWAQAKRLNLFGDAVRLESLQSEAGAAGTVHGALKTGVLATTYTSSQGLLLMLPNMYKIAGELLPTVFHVAARALATHALSIFGDHSDVMAVRQSGFAMLCANNVQEVMDLAAVAHLASLEGSLPFVHWFDGFRTSHETQAIEVLDAAWLQKQLPRPALAAFRARAMNPNHPYLSGTAQNSDLYFQGREANNLFYNRLPAIVQRYMQAVNVERGTDYGLVNYDGAADATAVVIAMGSVCDTAKQVVRHLNAEGHKVGVLSVHLYRPFPAVQLKAALPPTVLHLAVLDRTKEPGAGGEPLLLDVQSALYQSPKRPTIIGGRYGLASKDVTPAQLLSVYAELEKPAAVQRQRFTIGIVDDVTHLSLPELPAVDLTPASVYQAKFWGFGSDGTVGATQQAAALLHDACGQHVQVYAEYDAKKANGVSQSYLRFGDAPIDSAYKILQADYIGCHNAAYLHRYDLLAGLKDGGTFVLNTPWSIAQCQRLLPAKLKSYIGQHRIRLYIIDAATIARQNGLERRINTVMCTAFFKLANKLPETAFVPRLQALADQQYPHQAAQNAAAIAATCPNLLRVPIPEDWATTPKPPAPTAEESAFMKQIFRPVQAQKGDRVTVSDLIANDMLAGNLPTGGTAFEKSATALRVPAWQAANCIECNLCSLVCPHAAIRPFLADDDELAEAPEGFVTKIMRGGDGLRYRIQVSLEDCTGCGLCAAVCPAKPKALTMIAAEAQLDEQRNWRFAGTLRQHTTKVPPTSVRGSQFQPPLLEFSGACAGCGETAYAKLLTQLFGARLQIANATGCSSIWGASGVLGAYTTDRNGRGPAWSSSLFEDNAEFGYGMFLANRLKQDRLATQVQQVLDAGCGTAATRDALQAWLAGRLDGNDTQARADAVVACLQQEAEPRLQALLAGRDQLVKISQWLLGGDGWAYDIGFGGLDHVLASGADVNVLVFDNELYANTGGQPSKATPAQAVARFASGGKTTAKKPLGQMMTAYEHVYVAQIALEANPAQALKALEEAESYPGPSLVIGYTPCILHHLQGGMQNSLTEAKQAVHSGYWPLYRYDPRKAQPMQQDAAAVDFDALPALLTTQARFDTDTRQTVADAKRQLAALQKMEAQTDDR